MQEIIRKLRDMKPYEGLMSYKKIGMDESIMQGHQNAKFLFIGIQPSHPNIEKEKNKSYEEVVYNSPIGRRFYQLFLKKMNLKYDDIYITNLIKHAHPINSPPTEKMADYYFNILQQQVDSLSNLKYIILLGTFVKNYIRSHPLQTTAKIIEIYHPSYGWRIGKTEEHMNLLINKLKKKTKETQIQLK